MAEPDVWWDAAAAVRRSVRAAVAGRDADARELVPALVVGDDGGLDPDLADDFRTTGLTHLLAVSGTNLTLVVGFLLVARPVGRGARPLALRAGRARHLGFVLTARAEPSVVRAAAMGTVALVGMGRNGRSRGSPRAWGSRCSACCCVWPRLAVTAGFALSALATAGILLLAPGLARRADAVDAAVGRRGGLGAAGRAGGLHAGGRGALGPGQPRRGRRQPAGRTRRRAGDRARALRRAARPAVEPARASLVAAPAAWSAGWIIAVARWGADVPTAAVDWGTGPVPLVLLTVLCLLAVPLAPRLLGRPATTLACTGLLVVVMLVRPPTPGWPPRGWVLAMCDVGQGDAPGAARRAGRAAVVVDAGPEPAPIDACLDRLEVTAVPLLVLTHFHADHVDGVAGVLEGREVGEVEGTALLDPPEGAGAAARAVGRDPAPAAYGLTRRVGEVTLQTVWPRPGARPGDPAESAPNNASVVLVAEVGGVRVLLTGDVEPSAQAALARDLAGLRVDVLKVPHHGSRHQDLDWLTSLGARLALVSVGEDNDYGHPAPDLAGRARPLPARACGAPTSPATWSWWSGTASSVSSPADRVGRTMARTPSAAQVLGHVVLVTGKEEYLSARTVASVRDAVRAHDAEAELAESTASDLTLASLGEMSAPSLFSSIRCVVVRGLEDLPDESVDGLLDYCAAPADDVALVLVHSGGQKGSGVLTKLRKLSPVTEVKSEEVKPSEMTGFVTSEVASHGARIDSDAAAFLVQAVGTDLRSLAAAADQLTNDFHGEQLTIDKVQRYFGGRAEAKSFTVADAAFAGRRAAALEELRWALDSGTSPVLVTSAMAASARSLARYLGSPRGARDADLARDLGVPPWKVRTVRDQSRSWSLRGHRRRGPGGGPRRRRHQGPGARRVLHPRAARAHRRRAARRALSRAARKCRTPATRAGVAGEGSRQSEAAFLAIEDLRFAAWLPWMTPFEAALSSARIASRLAATAASLSPASDSSRNLRTAVFRRDFTAWLR